jgi:hypothetical protein
MSKDFRKPFPWQCSLGLEHGYRYVRLAGHNNNIDIADAPETISDITGGGLYPFPTTATTASIVSSDANDTSAGTGARTVRISGLDADFLEVSEVLTLNGATPVVGSQLFFRVILVVVLTAGSGGENAGEVDVTVDSSVVATINASENQTHIGAYTVPANNTLVLLSIQMLIGRQKAAVAALRWNVRENHTGGTGLFCDIAKYSLHSDSGAIVVDLSSSPYVLQEKSDLRPDIVEVGADDVSAGFVVLGYLIDNSVRNGS